MKLLQIFMVLWTCVTLSVLCEWTHAQDADTAVESETSQEVEESVQTPAIQKEVVKIGVICPLTGPQSIFGMHIQSTASLLAEYVNKKSEHYRYELIFEDGKFASGADPVSAARKLINIEKVKFLITGTSGETLPVGPIAQLNKVVLIAVIANHHEIRTLGDFIFRTYVDIDSGLQVLVKKLSVEKFQRVAIITDETAFTIGIAHTLEALLKDKVVASDSFSAEFGDMASVLLRAKKARPDVLYLNCATGKTCASMVNLARAQGMKEPIYSYYYFDNPDIREAVGKNGLGIIYISVPNIKDSSEQFAEFLSALKEQMGNEFKDEFVVRTTYDALKAILDSIEKFGPDSVKIKNELYKYDVKGALGRVSFDAAGDVKNLNFMLKKVTEDGSEYLDK